MNSDELWFFPQFFSSEVPVLVLVPKPGPGLVPIPEPVSVPNLVPVPEPDPKSDPVLAGGSNQPNGVTAQQWFVHGYLNAILLLSISVVHF